MKRKGNIYPLIIDKNNIRKAILNASKGKKDRKSVKEINDNIEYYILEIQKMLQNKTYKPSPYIKMKIHDGTRKKERIIYKPCFYPDQCIHWAIMQQIEPILMRGMYEFCCASIKNRGIHYASNHIKKILVRDRKNTKYCLKLDVKKFYPSINKEIMKRKFRKIIKDGDVLDLLDKIIDSGETGLPIGNYTSQWFANFYLQDLDHYIKEKLKIPYYIRYMDDMVLFYRNKKELHKCKNLIEEFLKKEELRLKENWQLFKTESRPLDFIGYRFYRGHTTLRSSNFLRIKRRIKKIYKKGRINYTDASSVLSYYGWLKHCDSYRFNEKYLRPYISLRKCKGVVKNEAKNIQRYKARKKIQYRKY